MSYNSWAYQHQYGRMFVHRKGNMTSKVIYERFLWFYGQVKKGIYPNATTMAEHFEISPKTIQHDIEFMQDRLFTPLVYVPVKLGYAFEDETYELPASWLNAVELTSLLASFRFVSTVPDDVMKTKRSASAFRPRQPLDSRAGLAHGSEDTERA